MIGCSAEHYTTCKTENLLGPFSLSQKSQHKITSNIYTVHMNYILWSVDLCPRDRSKSRTVSQALEEIRTPQHARTVLMMIAMCPCVMSFNTRAQNTHRDMVRYNEVTAETCVDPGLKQYSGGAAKCFVSRIVPTMARPVFQAVKWTGADCRYIFAPVVARPRGARITLNPGSDCDKTIIITFVWGTAHVCRVAVYFDTYIYIFIYACMRVNGQCDLRQQWRKSKRRFRGGRRVARYYSSLPADPRKEKCKRRPGCPPVVALCNR